MRIEVSPSDPGGGVFLNMIEAEGASRPAFVLVHGLSSNARLWGEVAAALAESGHPSFAVDLRSHGESDAPETGYDTATAAADLAVVVKELGLDRPIVVGQSWGGNVVVRLAARHPELVGGLGLVDGGWIDLSSSFPDWSTCEKSLRPSTMDSVTADGLRGWLRSAHRDWSESAIEATLANFRIRLDGTLERRLSIPRHIMILRSMWDDPPGPDLPQVAAPAVLLPALAPGKAKAKRIHAAAQAMRDARVAWQPGADHDLHAQRPGIVASELMRLVT